MYLEKKRFIRTPPPKLIFTCSSGAIRLRGRGRKLCFFRVVEQKSSILFLYLQGKSRQFQVQESSRNRFFM